MIGFMSLIETCALPEENLEEMVRYGTDVYGTLKVQWFKFA